MKKINLEFTVKIDKNIYTHFGEVKFTKEEFLKTIVLGSIMSNIDCISKPVETLPLAEQAIYTNYFKTLREFKQSVLDSATYTLIENDGGNIEVVKVECSFPYYENPLASAEKIIKVEVFRQVIEMNLHLSQEISRVVKINFMEKDINHFIAFYRHIAEFMNEAKKTVIFNGEKLEFHAEQMII